MNNRPTTSTPMTPAQRAVLGAGLAAIVIYGLLNLGPVLAATLVHWPMFLGMFLAYLLTSHFKNRRGRPGGQ